MYKIKTNHKNEIPIEISWFRIAHAEKRNGFMKLDVPRR
jgi:hypothetical protein